MGLRGLLTFIEHAFEVMQFSNVCSRECRVALHDVLYLFAETAKDCWMANEEEAVVVIALL